MKPTKLLAVALLVSGTCFFSVSCGDEGEKKDEKSENVGGAASGQAETHGTEGFFACAARARRRISQKSTVLK